MGVASFYSWLITKYSNLVTECKEERPTIINGIEIPINILHKNPNGFEFDNFYLDMNGVIHNCTHPDDGDPPENEEQMIQEIIKATDRIIRAVRPRKLIYFAIDGPPPRAKMNQQRARRFKAAKDKKKNDKIAKDLLKQSKNDGNINVPTEEQYLQRNKKKWDHNVITPGTYFMDKVSKAVKHYIHDRINNNEGWKNVMVIFSDSNVPGEGEHKLIEFIRNQRLQPNYNPNTVHVIQGLDADLIMLALATHEPNFYIMREKVFRGGKRIDLSIKNQPDKTIYDYSPYELLNVAILREHLQIELSSIQNPNQKYKFDLERAIDDFIFMCFFVGNDFLPHLPSLDIQEGAIDILMEIYKDLFPQHGWLTFNGSIIFKTTKAFLKRISSMEDSIFKQRYQSQKNYEEAMKRKRERDKNRKNEKELLLNGQKNKISSSSIFNPDPSQLIPLGNKNIDSKSKKKEKTFFI